MADDFVLRLADDFYVVAHDSISFRCLLADRLFRVGLAAALLGELVLDRKIILRGGELRIVDGTPPSDMLSATVLSHLRAERDITSVRAWIRVFTRGSYEQVVQRLTRNGLLRPREVRRYVVFTVVVFAPTRLTPVGAAEGRLASRLGNRLTLKPADLVLAGLMDATGLYDHVLARGTPPDTRTVLRTQLAALPEELGDLVEQTRTLVGALVASGFT